MRISSSFLILLSTMSVAVAAELDLTLPKNGVDKPVATKTDLQASLIEQTQEAPSNSNQPAGNMPKTPINNTQEAGKPKPQGKSLGKVEAEQARDALAKKQSDADSNKALEQVFQASEQSYTLLKKGDMTLTYGFDYTMIRDNQIQATQTAVINRQPIYTTEVTRQSQHGFTNAFTFDYGVWDNLTFSVRLPLVYMYDSDRDDNHTGLGDISTSLRYQPWAAIPGKPTTTFYVNVGLPTGDSAYETRDDQELTTGSGHYSLGGGASMSYVIDPVVLFGSLGYTYSFSRNDINQNRGDRELTSVDPGNIYSFSMGFAYSLSYDVSMSGSFQMNYSERDRYHFKRKIGYEPKLWGREQTSGLMNFSLGVRTAPDYIVNVNAGFGLTEDAPDILLGVTLPMDIKGLKQITTSSTSTP